MAYGDEIPPPADRLTVSDINRPVLYLPDGRALVRQIGFRPMQTSQTIPQLTQGGKRKPKKK